MADNQVFTLTFEASGEVTPAAEQAEAEESPTAPGEVTPPAEQPEAQKSPTDEEMTDG